MRAVQTWTMLLAALLLGSCEKAAPPQEVTAPPISGVSIRDLNGKVAIKGATGMELGRFVWIKGVVLRQKNISGVVIVRCEQVEDRPVAEPFEIDVRRWNNYPEEPEVGLRVACHGYERLEERGYTNEHWIAQDQQEARKVKAGLERDPAYTSVPHHFATHFLAFGIQRLPADE